jgi:SRSO17 transposase
MSLLDHPTAQHLLAEAQVPAKVLEGWPQRLHEFLARYRPRFYRQEQRELASVVLAGKLSDLQRKTAEPIAYQAGRQRKPVQHFVGAGKWDDEAVIEELRAHVALEIGDGDAALILDGSAFPKSGRDSCGVERQWCGRLGKIDNCQVGVFLGYASRRGRALVDRRLYLPRTWADDAERRVQGHVPDHVVFQTKLDIGLDLVERCATLPHGWVLGDDEFGRSVAFRLALRRRHERYLLDVPSNTLVRDLEERSANGRKPAFERVSDWAARQPARRWRKVVVRDGEKGRQVVRALEALVQTKDEDGGVGRSERLVVVRPVDHDGETTYALTSDLRQTALVNLVRLKHRRPQVEQLFQEAKGEVGLGQYEVRSWVGWHHHMTLSLLALWYVHLERRAVGGKKPGRDGPAAASPVGRPAGATTDTGGVARRNQRHDAAHRGGAHLPLAQDQQRFSTTAR